MNDEQPLVYNTQPYAHQIEALRRAWGNPGFAFFLEQGTGKSKIIVDEIVNCIERGIINCAVILAPNTVHANWKNEFLKHWPNYDKWIIQIWRSNTNKINREMETRRIIDSGKVLVFLMNIEALSSEGGKEYLKRVLLARKRAYLAVDESHKIKTPTAQRTKACIEIGNYAYIRRIATGTEAEEGLENLYSQFRFLNQNIIGLRSFTAFKSMFCVMGGYENREIKGYQNQEMLAQRIAPFTYQKRKKDCLDLPDKVYVTHEIGMTPTQMELYDRLEEELIIELQSGAIVDATMAMTRMMRLQQVLCGHINSSEEKHRHNPDLVPSHRADYTAEIVEEASSKCIVFCRFIMDGQLICSALANRAIRSVGISSLVDGSTRLKEIDRWRYDPEIKTLAITTATGGTGLTLNEASTTIFYSNGWSSTDRIQAEDRNHRIGTLSKVTYHDIVVKNRIDHRLLFVQKQKQTTANWFRSIADVQRFLTDDIQQ